jgi:hypothetical protein
MGIFESVNDIPLLRPIKTVTIVQGVRNWIVGVSGAPETREIVVYFVVVASCTCEAQGLKARVSWKWNGLGSILYSLLFASCNSYKSI